MKFNDDVTARGTRQLPWKYAQNILTNVAVWAAQCTHIGWHTNVRLQHRQAKLKDMSTINNKRKIQQSCKTTHEDE